MENNTSVPGVERSRCVRKAHLPFVYLLVIFMIVAGKNNVAGQTWYRQNGGTVTQTNMLYDATASDTNGVYVYNSGAYTLTHSYIRKTGNTSNIDSSEFYGRNASVLAKYGSITLSNDSITSSGTGVNGAFACYAGSSLVLISDTIATAGDYSHGIEATVGATVTATNCIITTNGGIGASAIATDCGGGIINVFGGSAATSLLMAAAIYSTGTVTDSGSLLTAAMENTCVIDGKNTIALTNCTLNAGLNGVKVYESAPDATVGIAKFTMDGGSITSAGNAIYVDGHNGGNANVLVKGGAVLTPATGNIVYTDSGANLVFTADGETLAGNIFPGPAALYVDTISTALQNHTTLTGIITGSSLTIDATSSWTLTGNSHIETLTDATVSTGTLTASNIIGNGYNVYYKPGLVGNSWLGGNSYSLSGGGCLLPEGAACADAGVGGLTANEAGVRLYPNPASGYLLVSYPAAYKNAVAVVMSMDGRVMQNDTLSSEETTVIDISALPDGVYMLRAGSNSTARAMKFIKE